MLFRKKKDPLVVDHMTLAESEMKAAVRQYFRREYGADLKSVTWTLDNLHTGEDPKVKIEFTWNLEEEEQAS